MVPALLMVQSMVKTPSLKTVNSRGMVASLPSAGSPLSQLPASAQSTLMAPVNEVLEKTLKESKQAKIEIKSLMIIDFWNRKVQLLITVLTRVIHSL